MAEVVTPYECEHLVASLQPLSVEEAGAEAWVAQAGAVERLSVGAVLQSAGGETEAVARLLADTEDKVSCDWLTQISILSSDWFRWPCSCSSWPRWRPGARACCPGCCAHARPAHPSPPTPSCSTRRAASGSCISTMSAISIISIKSMYIIYIAAAASWRLLCTTWTWRRRWRMLARTCWTTASGTSPTCSTP